MSERCECWVHGAVELTRASFVPGDVDGGCLDVEWVCACGECGARVGLEVVPEAIGLLSSEDLDELCAELAADGELDPREYLDEITGITAEIDAAADLELGRYFAGERWAA